MDKNDALNSRVLPRRLLSTQHPASDLFIPLGSCHSPYLPLFSLLPAPPPPSFFLSFPSPRSSPCNGSFCFGFSTSKGQSRIPWASVLSQPQPLHLLLPLQRPVSLGEGQGPWLRGVCGHVCLREWGHTSVQSRAADQLLTRRKD